MADPFHNGSCGGDPTGTVDCIAVHEILVIQNDISWPQLHLNYVGSEILHLRDIPLHLVKVAITREEDRPFFREACTSHLRAAEEGIP
ncbi:hypothetical protein D3C81_1632940 [compost metagenome]